MYKTVKTTCFNIVFYVTAFGFVGCILFRPWRTPGLSGCGVSAATAGRGGGRWHPAALWVSLPDGIPWPNFWRFCCTLDELDIVGATAAHSKWIQHKVVGAICLHPTPTHTWPTLVGPLVLPPLNLSQLRQFDWFFHTQLRDHTRVHLTRSWVRMSSLVGGDVCVYPPSCPKRDDDLNWRVFFGWIEPPTRRAILIGAANIRLLREFHDGQFYLEVGRKPSWRTS